MLALPTRVNLSSVLKKFDIIGQPNDTKFLKNVAQMADELLWYTETLRDKRLAIGAPK